MLLFTQVLYPDVPADLVAMLRRQKREISRENEEKSVKTDNFVQIEKFPSKNGRFRRLNIPPWLCYADYKDKSGPGCIIFPCTVHSLIFTLLT